jgi:hypothetical protein
MQSGPSNALDFARMGRPEARLDTTEEPPVDPAAAIEQAYRFHRARRRVRAQRRTAAQTANLRFYIVLMTLAFVFVLIVLAVWHEIQHVFGL